MLDKSPIKISGQVCLWLAIFIFGASSAITKKITDIGAHNFVGDRNPISLCNVLFIGNLCALLVLIPVYKKYWSRESLRKISQQEWLYLTIVALLAGAFAPAVIFQSLAITNVNNVVLIGRIEPVLTLALSVWFLQERVNRWEISGAIASFVGVSLTIFIQPMSINSQLHLGWGEILAACGAIAIAISTIIGKKWLGKVSLGIYNIYRTALGTIIFFIIANVIYGSHHFQDAFSPFLWKWMLLYGTIIVVVGQSFWNFGLRSVSIARASLVSSFTPIAGILAAYWILGETPTLGQYLGGTIILLGIALSQVGLYLKQSNCSRQEVENKLGFKGV